MQASMQRALTHGEKVRLIPVHRLLDLKDDVRAFRGSEPLNDFQRRIVSEMYRLEPPPSELPLRSIVLVAIPHPAYATVELETQAGRHRCLCLVRSDFEGTEQELARFLQSRGHRMLPAPSLPLKRLAARSGLAVYGRNNVCYVDGMGSHLSFAAYYSDVPCDDGCWMELRPAARCARCRVCLHDCPTGAIRESRFVIDNQRCLSYLNESSGDFPGWLPASVHHSVYDCLRCQLRCPMNRELAGNVIGPIELDREETELLLAGSPSGSLPPDLQRKARHLGLDEWPPDAIARNLRLLLERGEGAGQVAPALTPPGPTWRRDST